MIIQKRARDYGFALGKLPTGARNSITDVTGVTVGHCTIDDARFKTGVTAILPCAENPFFHKLPAGVCILNGFGKTAGLMQIQELGTIETPIILTSTLNVGLAHDALVGYMIERCAADGFDDLRSINPVVAECCDGTLSDIRARPVKAEHVRAAIAAASSELPDGCVGGGRGTICHGLKGGIGTASRLLEYDGQTYTIGLLTQTNHGRLVDLRIDGNPIGQELAKTIDPSAPDKGSVIAILATDLPLNGRQLSRVAARVSVGLSRLGSNIAHGSGDIFIAFSTANPYDPRETAAVRDTRAFQEELLDGPFRAAAECAEEAVLNSMLTATETTGHTGYTAKSLRDLL